jgi:hypothetical protein
LDAKRMNVSWGRHIKMRNTMIEKELGFVVPYYDPN